MFYGNNNINIINEFNTLLKTNVYAALAPSYLHCRLFCYYFPIFIFIVPGGSPFSIVAGAHTPAHQGTIIKKIE